MDTDNKYEEVSKYFPLQEWNNLPEYEKNRFHNLLVNYNKMCELGFSPRKPDFMLSRINKTRIQKLQKENDEEWTPNKVKRPKWNPPRKLAREAPSVEQKIEDQAFVQFTAADISRSQEIYHCLLQKIAELRKKLGFEDDPEYQLPTQHRYPRRNIERKDYREREVPDDDDYIYCDECEREWEGDCPEHGALVNVPDTKVPDTVNGPDRAEKTVPKELCIAQSSIHNAGKGVWTRVLLQKGLRFGPYEGVKVDSPNGEGYCWQIRRNQRISHYVDAWDSSRSNWMRYVNCARHEEEQNLIAFQYKGEMYYRTFRTIRAHVELLVWYGDDFGRELGIDKENYHKPLPPALKSNIFPSISCNVTYSCPVYHLGTRGLKCTTDAPVTTGGMKGSVDILMVPTNITKCGFIYSEERNCKYDANYRSYARSGSSALGTQLHEYSPPLNIVDLNFTLHKHRSIYKKSSLNYDALNTINTKSTPSLTIISPSTTLESVLSIKCNESSELLPVKTGIQKCENINSIKKYYERQSTHASARSLDCKQRNNRCAIVSKLQRTERQIAVDACRRSYQTCKPLLNLPRCKRMPARCMLYSPNDFTHKIEKQDHEKSETIDGKINFQQDSGEQVRNVSKRAIPSKFSEIHETLHSKKQLSKLNVCRKPPAQDGRRSNFERHTKGDSGEDSGRCTLSPKLQLTGNNKYHHEETPFDGEAPFGCNICNVCKKVCSQKGVHSEEGPYECNICKKNFQQKSDLTSHESIQSVERTYECNVCKKRFTVKSNLHMHLRQHSDQKQFECNVCKKRYSWKNGSRRQEGLHPGEKLYECHLCKKSFPLKSHPEEHIRTHSGEWPFECSACNKRFSWKLALLRHELTHSGEEPYECNECKKRFSQKSELTRHERIHSGERPYPCHICKKRFSHECYLKRHERTHSGERPYECNVCKKRFSEKSGLTRHERIHSGERRYACHVCKKRFSRGWDLEMHERTHSGNKPYACHVCKKSFALKSNRDQHLRIHSGERPFQCSVCKKRFWRKSNLVRHERIHSAERPYACHVCRKSFTQKAYLYVHLRLHSGDRPFGSNVCKKRFSQEVGFNKA